MSPAKGIGSQRPGVLAETEAVLAATERRKTGDGPVFVGVDVQMASFRHGR